jgi:tetratricopeptide (TPR) repeat protein
VYGESLIYATLLLWEIELNSTSTNATLAWKKDKLCRLFERYLPSSEINANQASSIHLMHNPLMLVCATMAFAKHACNNLVNEIPYDPLASQSNNDVEVSVPMNTLDVSSMMNLLNPFTTSSSKAAADCAGKKEEEDGSSGQTSFNSVQALRNLLDYQNKFSYEESDAYNRVHSKTSHISSSITEEKIATIDSVAHQYSSILTAEPLLRQLYAPPRYCNAVLFNRNYFRCASSDVEVTEDEKKVAHSHALLINQSIDVSSLRTLNKAIVAYANSNYSEASKLFKVILPWIRSHGLCCSVVFESIIEHTYLESLLRQGEYAEAERILMERTATVPNDAQAWRRLSKLYEIKGECTRYE